LDTNLQNAAAIKATATHCNAPCTATIYGGMFVISCRYTPQIANMRAAGKENIKNDMKPPTTPA
jgi:hypothetical protein